MTDQPTDAVGKRRTWRYSIAEITPPPLPERLAALEARLKAIETTLQALRKRFDALEHPL